MAADGREVVVVSHTHWDREWYRSAEEFRIRLVALVDDVLARQHPFLLDGQAIVVEDYLAWRPERAAEISAGLRSGLLEAGPWYVLADNLLPSGEALVRNLLAGRRALARLRSQAPPVLYCPDAFGHPAAGPLLAAGFGLRMAVVWRGYGGRGWPPGDSARWRAASGDEVLLHHLPPSGYEYGANLPVDAGAVDARWRELLQTLAQRTSAPSLLVLNGADHHALQPDIALALERARGAFNDCHIHAGRLSGFAALRGDWAASCSLPVVQGELRTSPGHVWALQGTAGTRAGQKRGNARAERFLVREVEPWAALAWWRTAHDDQFAERAAWRLLLECHPHDTLCGCSVDSVAASMDDRLARVRAAACEVRERALSALAGFDESRTRAAFDTSDRAVLLTNPAARARTGVVEVEVDLPLAPAPVGPGSREVPPRAVPPFSIGAPALPMQRLHGERRFVRHESSRHYPRNALVQRERVLVWVQDLPAYGVARYPVVERRARPRVARGVAVRDGVLDNGMVAAWHDETAGLCLAGGGHTLTDLLGFESVGDRGDLYTPSSIPGTGRLGSIRSARVTMRGPLRAELTLVVRLPVAERHLTSAVGEPLARPRTSLQLRVRVQLDAGVPWCRVRVDGVNTAPDQRVRVTFRTGCVNRHHRADAAFGTLVRPCGRSGAQPGDVELLPPTDPLHRHVSLFDATHGRGFTVASDGLAEYEAGADGRVSVTLVRAVGELSRVDLPERPGHAGWPASVPAAQAMGPFAGVFAIFPHGGDSAATRAAIEHMAEDVLVPPRGATTVATTGDQVPGVSLDGAALAFSSCKRSEDGLAIVVRCRNLGDVPAAGAWTLSGLSRASLARLDETPIGALPVRDDRVQFVVPPHAVLTLRLERD